MRTGSPQPYLCQMTDKGGILLGLVPNTDFSFSTVNLGRKMKVITANNDQIKFKDTANVIQGKTNVI